MHADEHIALVHHRIRVGDRYSGQGAGTAKVIPQRALLSIASNQRAGTPIFSGTTRSSWPCGKTALVYATRAQAHRE